MSKQAGRMSQGANDFLTPYAPTIGTATDVGTSRAYNNGAVTVTFTHAGPNAATSYTASGYCSVHGTTHSVTGASSPLTIQGFGSGAVTTITVVGTNAAGTGTASAASNSVTVTTVPQSPSLSSVTNTPSNRAFGDGLVVVTVEPQSTGGKAISSHFAISNAGQSASSGSSAVSVTGLSGGTSFTFQGRVTNANGNSDLTSASGAVTVTTVPQTPDAPSASSPSAGTDTVSWSVPSNGGSAITNYFYASSDGKSGNTGTSTSVNVGQEQGTAQTYTVRADNANGSSGTSAASNSVTTVYSFTPYSFVPYSFVPYSFVPYSFTPYSFTPYSFTPYSFTPFSAFGAFGAFGAFSAFGAFGAFSAFGAFGAFSAFGAYNFSPGKSIGVDTLVLTTEGYTLAKNLKVGDVLVSAEIPGLGVDFTKEQMVAWITTNPESIEIVPNKETTIMNIGMSTATVAVMIGNELYSGTHYMLTQRDGVGKMIQSEDLLVTDKLWSADTNSWTNITDLTITNIPHEVVSIDCEPNDLFYTDKFLVYDGYQIEY